MSSLQDESPATLWHGHGQHSALQSPRVTILVFLSLSELKFLKVAASWQFQEILQRTTPKSRKKRNYQDISEKSCFTDIRREIIHMLASHLQLIKW